MRKLLVLLFLPLMIGCGVTYNLKNTVNSNSWYPVELRPSQISTNGEVFYVERLNDSEYIDIYFDDELFEDGTYYYNQLFSSYGWTRGGGNIITASQFASRPSHSTLHISIKRGIAIYIYPDQEFQVFKVKLVRL